MGFWPHTYVILKSSLNYIHSEIKGTKWQIELILFKSFTKIKFDTVLYLLIIPKKTTLPAKKNKTNTGSAQFKSMFPRSSSGVRARSCWKTSPQKTAGLNRHIFSLPSFSIFLAKWNNISPTLFLVIQSDLSGMVKWPFQGVKWPPTRGWKGHFESPGWGW